MKRFFSVIMALAMIITLIPSLAFAENSGSDAEIIATHYYGDVNFDDLLNTFDASEILKICAGMKTLTDEQKTLTYEGFMKIDANKSGSFNTADATFILQFSADMKPANAYYEYAEPTSEPTAEPTSEPTNEPTGEPTAQPTGEPTAQPTGEPTAEPTENPDAYLTINCYDSFNEIQAVASQMGVSEGTNVINIQNVVLPEGEYIYLPADLTFSVTVTVANGVCTPSSITLNVVPYMYDDMGNQFKVILTEKGFDKINNELNGYFCLGNDLDLAQKNRQPFGWNWTDPSQADKPFSGIFDGRGYSIKNVQLNWMNNYDEVSGDYYDSYSNVGLFALNSGVIRNLNLHVYKVIGDMSVGAVVGYNAGVVLNCHCKGSMASYEYRGGDYGGIGGICGDNFGTVKKCSYDGFVSGLAWAGGLVGVNHGGALITESYFAGAINFSWSQDSMDAWEQIGVGGICALGQGDVKDCYVYCAAPFRGHSCVGSMVGAMAGGTYANVFVVNNANDFYGDAYGYDDYYGLIAQPDEIINSENSDLSTYSSDVWDFSGGACDFHNTFPDLINNPRPAEGFYVESD